MSLLQEIVEWTKNRLIYMSGRGILGFGVVLGSSFGPAVFPFAVAGTAALQAVISWRKERRQESMLLSAYKEEVGAILDKNPEDVTTDDLQTVAQGDKEKGIEGNAVLAEALEYNSKRGLMEMVTSALSGLAIIATTFGVFQLLFGVDLISQTGGILERAYEKVPFLGDQLTSRGGQVLGTMFLAGTGLTFFNQVFDRIGEKMLDIDKEPAIVNISKLRREIDKGKMLTPEQVFGVYVAANESLGETIAQEFGQPYEKLSQRQQHLALEEFGQGLNIHKLTYDINHYHIEPEELAFTAVGQSSGVPAKEQVDFREKVLRDSQRGEMLNEFKQAILGEDKGKATSAEADAIQPEEPSRLTSEHSSSSQGFVKRLGLESHRPASHRASAKAQTRPDTHASFAKREEARRQQATEITHPSV